jgi:UDP-glucose 4-epimerase
MNILLTGASSFTGYWIVQILTRAGHRVVAPLRGLENSCKDVKALRVQSLAPLCQLRFGIPFGDESFLKLLQQEGPFDILCHHAAEVGNYRSPDFDALGALRNNVNGLIPVLRTLRAQKCSKMILTGSVFEQDEGVAPPPLNAFSPYGLSKGLTWDFVRYYALREGFSLGKFVIPNPFGPFEEPRFVAFLMKNWLAGQTPSVKTPDYVRDNIHVDLLAMAYRQMVQTLPAEPGFMRSAPSGYVQTQAAFAQRVAMEMEKRLGVACPLRCDVQTDFSEPLIRMNSDRLDAALGWDESAAWDRLAEFYKPK